MLIEDEGVNVLENDWDLPLFEEHLKLLPVVFFLLVIARVVEGVHLDV